MQLAATPLAGAYLLHPTLHQDERGFFARTYSPQELRAAGLDIPTLDQSSIAFNRRGATLRGMHYQTPPHTEYKLVRCTTGAIFDVIVDLREDSQTRHQWYGIELSAANRTALYVPPGFAHGYITLCDDSEVYYMIGGQYSAEHACGVRWNDPAFSIRWPVEPKLMTARDANYPLMGGGS